MSEIQKPSYQDASLSQSSGTLDSDGSEGQKISKLAQSLKRTPMRGGHRNNLFLIGAGASVTARVPAVRDIARLLVLREYNDRNNGEIDLYTLLEIVRSGNDEADKAYEKLVSDKILKDRRYSYEDAGNKITHVDWPIVYDD